MTPQQLHAYVAFCQSEVLESAAEQRDRAVGLVVWHLRRQTPAHWLPDILYARLWRAPFNSVNDSSRGAALGQRGEDYAAGVTRWHRGGSEARGQKFGTCQPRGG